MLARNKDYKTGQEKGSGTDTDPEMPKLADLPEDPNYLEIADPLKYIMAQQNFYLVDREIAQILEQIESAKRYTALVKVNLEEEQLTHDKNCAREADLKSKLETLSVQKSACDQQIAETRPKHRGDAYLAEDQSNINAADLAMFVKASTDLTLIEYNQKQTLQDLASAKQYTEQSQARLAKEQKTYSEYCACEVELKSKLKVLESNKSEYVQQIAEARGIASHDTATTIALFTTSSSPESAQDPVKIHLAAEIGENKNEATRKPEEPNQKNGPIEAEHEATEAIAETGAAAGTGHEETEQPAHCDIDLPVVQPSKRGSKWVTRASRSASGRGR